MTVSTVNAPIVAAVDGSENALNGVRWAAAAAVRENRPLQLVSVVEPPALQFGEGIVAAGAYLDSARALAGGALDVARLLAAEVAPGVTGTDEVVDGHPAQVLRGLSHRAHIVVLGRRGLGGVKGLLLGSVSSDVAAHADCPVVVVSDTPPVDGPVVVGVDGSPVSTAATAAAFTQAALLGTRLIAVYGYGDHPGVGTFDRIEGGRQRVIDEARAVLGSRLGGRHEDFPDLSVDTVVSIEHPAAQIIETAADANAQLIVMGSRGRGGFRSLLLGSTSQAVLQVAQCPVMIVPA